MLICERIIFPMLADVPRGVEMGPFWPGIVVALVPSALLIGVARVAGGVFMRK
jgi:hypothetical protein